LKLPPNKGVVLGIDPGLATTGWGVIERASTGLKLIAFGAILTPAKQSLPERLLHIQKELSQLIVNYRPDVLAIEELFFAKFAVSIASTAQARGVILLTAAQQSIPLIEYNPRAVKMAMTGFGSASKIQMQSMVQRQFRLKELPRPDDAADALAIALCHLQTNRGLVSEEVSKRVGKAANPLLTSSLTHLLTKL
jgi:crossover junction endodeoxyribonuclease RuvC